LDNFEHLIARAQIVSQILQQAPRVKVLATSRERLNLQGEQIMEITGLSFPDSSDMNHDVMDLKRLNQFSAVEFFLHAARRAQMDFKITPSDYTDIAHITQLVGGMPLGLELAASWITILTPNEIVTEIEQGLDFLESRMQDIPERQRSIRAVFDNSWKWMSRREQQVFPKLSVFRGGFSKAAARIILGITPYDLMDLVNKSLLQRTMDGRFNLHPLLLQYATDILNDRDDYQAVHDAHCTYFTDALEDLGKSMTDRRQQEAYMVFDADIDNAWAAWEWAVKHHQSEQIDQAAEGLISFLSRQYRFEEALEAVRAAEESLTPPRSANEQRTYGHILTLRGMLEMRLGNMEDAPTYLHQSWEQIEQAAASGEETRYEQAYLFIIKAYMSVENGNLEIARDLLEQSLAIFKQIDHKYGASEALYYLGWLSIQQGELDQVDQYQRDSLELKRQIGDHFGLANELYHIGLQEAFHHGNIDRAKGYFWESSDIFQDLGDPISKARALRIMDDLYILEGWFDFALVTRQKMMQQYQNLGDLPGIGFQHNQLGEAYYHLGDYEHAESECRQAIRMLEGRFYPFEQTFSRWQLGMTLLAQNRVEEAHELFEKCMHSYENIRRLDGLGSAYAGLACAALALGNVDPAWEHSLAAIKLLSKYRHIFWMFYALGSTALLYVHQGEELRAIEIYSLIRRYNFVANSQWFTDVFGRRINSYNQYLSKKQIEAAHVRVQSMDIWDMVNALVKSGKPI
jgi:predicted ATPase